MKSKLLIYIFALLIVTISVLLLLPYFIKLEDYKRDIEKAIKEQLSLESKIEGQAHLKFFPEPQIIVENLLVKNISNSKISNVLRVDSVVFSFSLRSLLHGNFGFSYITLNYPTLNIENLDDGKNNLRYIAENFIKKTTDKKLPGKIKISNGSIIANNDNAKENFDYINANIDILSKNGPFEIRGSLIKNTQNINFDFNLGKIEKDAPIELTIKSDSFTAEAKGSYLAGEDKKSNLKFKLESNNLKNFLEIIYPESLFFEKINSGEKIVFTGDILINKNLLKLDNFILSSKSIKGKGNIEATFPKNYATNLNWYLKSQIERINIDELLKSDEQQKLENQISAVDFYDLSSRTKSLADFSFDLPEKLSLIFDVNVKEVLMNGKKASDLIFAAEISNGRAFINNLSAKLPGNSFVQFHGQVDTNKIRPMFKGQFNARGDNLREFVTWQNSKYEIIPQDVLKIYEIDANIEVTPRHLRLTDFNLDFDKTTLGGDVDIDFVTGKPIGIIDISLEEFDFDKYKLTPEIYTYIYNFLKNAHKQNFQLYKLNLINSKFAFNFDLSKITINNNYLKKVTADAQIEQGNLKIVNLIFDGKDFDTKIKQLSVSLSVENPEINLEMTANKFNTDFLFLKNDNKNENGKKWFEQEFTFKALAPFNGKIAININQLLLQNFLIEDFKLNAKLDKKKLANEIKGKLFGSNFVTNLYLGFADVVDVKSTLTIIDMSLEDIRKIHNFPEIISGILRLQAQIESSGNNLKQMYNNLNITGAKVELYKPIIVGFDIDNIVQKSYSIFSVVDMRSLVKEALQSGTINFVKPLQFSLTTKIEKNKRYLISSDINLYGKLFVGKTKFIYDFINNFYTSSNIFAFRPTKNDTVSLQLTTKGIPGSLEKNLNTTELEKFITNRPIR